MPIYNAFKNQLLRLQVTALNAQGQVIPTPPGVEFEQSKPLGTIDENARTFNTGNVADQTDISAKLGTVESAYTTVIVTDDPGEVFSLVLNVLPPA
jgi:hypothetical protein